MVRKPSESTRMNSAISSIDMREASRNDEQPQFCDACFTGQYPTRLLDFEGHDNVRTLSLLATSGS